MRAVLTIWLLLSGAAYAEQGAVFTYKGVKIGDSAAVVAEKLPTYQCSGSECDYSMRLCVERMSRNDCDSSASFGGAWVKNGIVKLHDGKVAEIVLLFVQSEVAVAAEAAVQAYGNPASDGVKEIQTRAGAKFASWDKLWKSGVQTLQIRQHAGDLNTGMAKVTSTETQAIFERQRKLKATEGARDF